MLPTCVCSVLRISLCLSCPSLSPLHLPPTQFLSLSNLSILHPSSSHSTSPPSSPLLPSPITYLHLSLSPLHSPPSPPSSSPPSPSPPPQIHPAHPHAQRRPACIATWTLQVVSDLLQQVSAMARRGLHRGRGTFMHHHMSVRGLHSSHSMCFTCDMRVMCVMCVTSMWCACVVCVTFAPFVAACGRGRKPGQNQC